MSGTVAFLAADTLGVTLFQMKDQLIADEVRKIPWGAWKFDLEMSVKSDVLSHREASFWVTFGDSLQMYAVVRQEGCWMFVFDAIKLDMERQKAEFKDTGLMAKRWVDIKPAVLACFTWVADKKSAKWQQELLDNVKW